MALTDVTAKKRLNHVPPTRPAGSRVVVLYIDLRPGQTCHSKDGGSDSFQWQLWEEIAYAGLADNMGQGKISWYSHRPMHRKRVTCELHDSYFNLMTIKHAIPKIEWAIEQLYNSVTGSQLVWRPEKLEKRCVRESQHSAESWAPGSPIEQPWRTRKTQRWWP